MEVTTVSNVKLNAFRGCIRTSTARRLMKIVLIGLLFLSFETSYAQKNSESAEKASITVRVGAEIVSSIEMVTLRNIRFGKVQPSQQILRINPITDNKTGKMKIIGQPNGTIRVNYQETHSLQQIEGNYSVNFEYRLAGNSVDNQETSDFIDFNNFEAQLNQDGEYFIWVGGNVQVSELQPGNYQGDFTVEVEYM